MFLLCLLLFFLSSNESQAAKDYIPSDSPPDWQYAASERVEQRFEPNHSDTPQRSTGIIYSGVGKRSLREAAVSALSVRELMPSMNVTLVTDKIGASWCAEHRNVCNVFDFVLQTRFQDDTWGFRFTKINAYLLTPYDNTLFLDTDTLLCSHADEAPEFVRRHLRYVWQVLDRFEFAATHGSFIHDVALGRPALTDLNSGVVLYKKSDNVKKLLFQWRKELMRKRAKSQRFAVPDQGPLMKSILAVQDVRIFVLPPEWNGRKSANCAVKFSEFTKPFTRVIFSHWHAHAAHKSYDEWLQDKTRAWPPVFREMNEAIAWRRKNYQF